MVLRVLLITGNAIVGGMERTVARLVERLPVRDYAFVALCPFESPFTSQLRAYGVDVHVASIGDKLRWHSIQRAAELVREYDIDVIHAHMPAAHTLAGLAGRATRTPVLATVHSMHVSMQDLEMHRLAGTHLCVVSDAARAHALAVGADRSRLTVIRNGVDTEAFAPALRRVTGDGKRAPVVGYVGRLSPEKNPGLFLHVAALVRASAPDTRFVIIGDGPLREELERLARTFAIDAAVTFAGECDDMPPQYRALDVLLSTSWHEGTSLAILEAMASGVPVVATDVGGSPELVASGVTGWLTSSGEEVPMAERTLALLRDEPLRRRFGTAARARAVREFQLDDCVQRTAALLHDVARTSVKPRGTAVRPLRGVPDRPPVVS